MSQARADDTSVRFSPELSEGEKEATRSRKVKVVECLKNLGISCDETMPNIAVLGSGGGLRATIALLGTLTEMKKQGLLDAVMYLCGVSGSTWCMSTLYNGKDWARNIEALEGSLCDHLSWAPVDIAKELDLVTKAAEDELFSLTDVWEAFIVKNIMKLSGGRKLSEHKDASCNGINPYPIYAAVEYNTYEKEKTSQGAWFEFTPDECGFPGLDVFVSTKSLGSKFQGGKLTEPKEEKNISYLQSLWGSAFGNMHENKQFLIAHIMMLFRGLPKPSNFRAVKDGISSELSHLGHSIGDIWKNPENTFGNMLQSTIEQQLKALGLLPRSKNFLWKLKTCFNNWTWGSTNNFLYENGKIQSSGLDKREVLNLIDAGVANNCGYPPVLRPARRVGLILSFDFGIEEPFETLKRASKYCVENQIPFPQIDPDVIKGQANPSNCYIFEGKNTPTVMHFPLFNTKNCPGSHEIRKSRMKFLTAHVSYPKNEIEELLNKAKMNVAENKKKILEQIWKIVSSPTK